MRFLPIDLRGHHWLLLCGCWLGLCLVATDRSHAAGDDSDPASAESATPSERPFRADIDPELKTRTLSQAFVMLGGIIVGGTLLLLVVVMWGNRTRRFARRPLPHVAKRDDLWFLKPKPADQGPHETPPDAASSGSQTET